MEKVSEIIQMGGYGMYVWPSFAVAAVIMIVMVAASLRSLWRAQKSLSALQESSTFTSGNEA